MPRLAERLEDLLEAIPGTKDVDRVGAPDEEVQVAISADELASLGLTPQAVAASIRASDAKVTAGVLRTPKSHIPLEVAGEIDSLERLRAVPLKSGAGSGAMTVGDVATVTKGPKEPRSQLALAFGRRAVIVAARMEGHTRIDRWGPQAHAAVEAFRRQLPPGVHADIIFDQSGYTQVRLGELLGNLLLGGLLVSAVILLLMGWRSALLVGASLPLSALAVVYGLQLLDVPIEQMSITGLIIALGLLIDNAIVVVDGFGHRRSQGLGILESIDGAVRSLFAPLLGSTLTTVLAFTPIAIMPGGAGEFVGSIAISVILALLSSFALSLTVVPALAGLLDRWSGGAFASDQGGILARGLRIPSLVPSYRKVVSVVVSHPALGVAIALALPLLGFYVAGSMPEQFFPGSDRDQFQVEIRLAEHASLAETEAAARRARAVLLASEHVEDVHWFLGTDAPKVYYNMLSGRANGPQYGLGLVQLRSTEGTYAAIRHLQQELDRALPDVWVIARPFEQGPPYDAPVSVRITGPSLATLRQLGDDVRHELARVPGVTHTRTTLTSGRPKLLFRADERVAQGAGLTHSGIAQHLAVNLDGQLAGSLSDGRADLPIRVRLAEADRERLTQIAELALPVSPGIGGGGAAWMPLSATGAFELVPEPGSIARRNGVRVNNVQGFVQAGVLPSQILAALRTRLKASGFALPPGYALSTGGESAERDRAVGQLASSAALLLVLMAATLIVVFNSVRLAAVIAVVGALSIGLALLSLWVGGYPLGFMAIVGSMGLVGVAINDSIVVLSALRESPAARRGETGAIVTVVLRETRHVLATTLTTMIGFAPLMLAGGGFWPPVAVAIGGGVLGATLLALTFTPSAYRLVIGRCPRLRGSVEPRELAPRPLAASPA